MTKRTFTQSTWSKEPKFRALCKALTACKTSEEVSNFLRDVGTLSELFAWSERLEVARQLAKGQTYRKVAENTGASTTTITCVASFLNGGEGGYKKALNVKEHHHASSLAGRGRRR